MTDNGLISKIYKAAQTTQHQKTQIKNGQTAWMFLQKRHTDGQRAHERMLNIVTHQMNAN